MKYIPSQSPDEKRELIRRLCDRRKGIEPAERFRGSRYEVADDPFGYRLHRVHDRRCGSIAGEYRSLAVANARASEFENDSRSRFSSLRPRAYTALTYAVLFTFTASAVLRRVMP